MMSGVGYSDLNEVVKDVYLGNMFAAMEMERRRDLGITHVLSVMDRPLEPDVVADASYRCVIAQDSESFSLLAHFDECANFIARALGAKGRILVHCVAGVSRSSAAVAAYLMSYQGMTLLEAMEIIQRARSVACPNDGFMRQLALYQEMGGRLNILHPAYRRYQLEMFSEQVQSASKVSCIPRHLLTSTDSAQTSQGQAVYRCRKCRTKLFYSNSLMVHEEGEGESAFDWRKKVPKSEKIKLQGTGQKCEKSLFVEPQKWMSNGILEMEGKLQCPGKCKGKIGSYVWYGEHCPCGAWVAPAFHIQAGKVDACVPPQVALPHAVPLALLHRQTDKDVATASGAGQEVPPTEQEGRSDEGNISEEVQSLSLDSRKQEREGDGGEAAEVKDEL